MSTALGPTIADDVVLSFDINPGTLLQFLESRSEKGPRLKCFEGSVTLVSPGMSHETAAHRLDLLVLAICHELGIPLKAVASTTWFLPKGAGDTAYEADKSYFLRDVGPERIGTMPDLAIEVVVSHSASKALRAGSRLAIPELWVFEAKRGRLAFHRRIGRGKAKGTYRAEPRSRTFPSLSTADVLERLADPADSDITYLENCREWARQVLVPRARERAD